MEKAFAEVLPNVKVRYDHFHVTQSIKDASRFLKNKYESSVTKCIKESTKLDKAKTKQQQQKQGYHLKKAVKEMGNYDYVYNQFSTLTNWLQYDVLQLQSVSPEDRDSMFDFIIDELEVLSKRHPPLRAMESGTRGRVDPGSLALLISKRRAEGARAKSVKQL
jgi:hypothetical protein